MTSTMPRATGKRGPQSRLPSRWVALALLASAQLMLVLDVTVVTVALPDIGAALHLQRGELPWVMTIYTVFFGGLMLLGGRIADLFGARRMTLGGLALFTAASLLCGLSGDAATLLAGRSLQGLGAALMSPAALAAVMTLFTGASRGKALGVWSALAGAGSALGVVLGGVLTSEAGWRWVFTINVPIGVALLIAIPLVVPARPPSGAAERGLDVPGAVLVTAGTAAAIYGLINVGSHGWAAAPTVLPLVLAVAIWTAFALLERRVRRPLLTVGLLRRRAVLAGSFLMLAATGLLVGGFFLGSFALQHAHGYSALHTGLVFLPVAVATITGAQAGTQVLARRQRPGRRGHRPRPGGRRIRRRGRLAPARADGDRAEHRRPRDRGDVRHRLHRLARRCRARPKAACDQPWSTRSMNSAARPASPSCPAPPGPAWSPPISAATTSPAPSPWERPARWSPWRSRWRWSRPSARTGREGNRRCQASRQEPSAARQRRADRTDNSIHAARREFRPDS